MSDDVSVSKRGRPLGSTKGYLRNSTRWNPSRWRPEYDRIVTFSACGKSNKWIAEQMGFTPQHISNILNLQPARELMEKIQSRLRERIELDIPTVMLEVATKTAERLKSMVYNDELFEKSPFAVIDRGLDVLKGLGHLRGGGNGASQPTSAGNTTVNIGAYISASQKNDILDGLKKVAEIKQLHDGTNG